MINLTPIEEGLLNKKKATFKRRNLVYFRIQDFTSFAVLSLSAYFSFSFWANVTGYQSLGMFITFLVSLLAYAVGRKLSEDLAIYKRSYVPPVLLFIIGLANLYTDIHGVRYISKNTVKKPTAEQVVSLDATFNRNRSNYERRLTEQNAIIEQNKNWQKYSAERGRWAKHARWKKAVNKKARIESSLDELIKAHTKQRDKAYTQYTQDVSEYKSEVDFLTTKYRYFASACFVVFILCLFVRTWYLSNVLAETEQRTPIERYKTEERTETEQRTPPPPPERKPKERRTKTAKEVKLNVYRTGNDKKDKFFELMLNGNGDSMSIRQIANEIGVSSTSTVHKWKKEYYKIKDAI